MTDDRCVTCPETPDGKVMYLEAEVDRLRAENQAKDRRIDKLLAANARYEADLTNNERRLLEDKGLLTKGKK